MNRARGRRHLRRRGARWSARVVLEEHPRDPNAISGWNVLTLPVRDPARPYSFYPSAHVSPGFTGTLTITFGAQQTHIEYVDGSALPWHAGGAG